MNFIELDPYTSDKQIPQDHLIQICKYRQGANCCKYICFPREKKDFYCVKTIQPLKEKLDQTKMIAEGDNCPGLPNEKS